MSDGKLEPWQWPEAHSESATHASPCELGGRRHVPSMSPEVTAHGSTDGGA